MNERTSFRWIRVRLIICTLLIALLLGVIVHRAFLLQSVEGPRLRELAEQQYLREVKLPPRRGTIYDRHGTPLAVSVDVESVHANPRIVGARAAAVARQLEDTLGVDGWLMQKRLSSRRYFVWVKRRISSQQAKRVRALKIPGVFLTKESRRFYPNHGLGSTVVGFAGMDAKGLEGLELSYDGWLRGKPVRIAGLHDALGRLVLSDGMVQTASDSHDLRLALDKFIQFETEQAISAAYANVKPKTGWVAAVVMDPRTGDVLAMASAPSFNPNQYGKAKPSHWRNRTVTDAFEPGSTLKIFTVGGALDRGFVKLGEVIDCEQGRWRVGHYTLHDSHHNGKLDLAGILKKSSNIGVSKIAFRMGKPSLYSTLRRFGFGQKTGINVRGERSGALRPHQRWSDVGLANIAFGQGMTTTVIQLAQGLAAVANGGVMMKPRLILSIKDDQGKRVKVFPPEGRRVLSHGVSQQLLSMMAGVTEKGGTGVDAALERYSVAGKTGTAQKVDPVTRRYSTDRWVSSFMGAGPARNPRLVAVVVVNEPDGEKHYGGEVAGPIFKRITAKAMAYLGVKPDRRLPEQDRPGRTRQAPVVAEGFVSSETAPPLPGQGGPHGEVLVPDFTGMSLMEVIEVARKVDLRLELIGSGRAVAQSPGPGPTSTRTLCRVSFQPPG